MLKILSMKRKQTNFGSRSIIIFFQLTLIFGLLLLSGKAGLLNTGSLNLPTLHGFYSNKFTNTSIQVVWTKLQNFSYTGDLVINVQWRPEQDASDIWPYGMEVPAENSSLNVDGLISGVAYEFQAGVIVSGSFGPVSQCVGETLAAYRATNVRGTVDTNSQGSFFITWALPVNWASSYAQMVVLSADGLPPNNTAPLLLPDVKNYYASGLLPFAIYTVFVETMFEGPQGEVRSQPASFRTPAVAPQQVALLLFEPGGPGNASLTLTWDDLSGLAGGGVGISVQYELEVRQGAEPFPDPAPLAVSGPGLALYSLPLNTPYSFRVTAINAAGLTGPPSAIFSTVTPAAAPLAP